MPEDLAWVRAVERADVYKVGRPAATLARTPDGVEFAYRADYLAASGPPVATTLPLSAEPLLRPGGALPAYFSGLLPEGRRLGALRREIKTSLDDELSLLLAVGSDAVGDVRVVADGTPPTVVPPRLEIGDPADVRFADVLAGLGIRSDRNAIPGVQDKVSARMINLPVAQSGSRYILKLDPPEFSRLVENEACLLRAAALAGLDVVHAEVVRDAVGCPGLLVERFDRVPSPDSGEPTALAVEDGCQVRGRPPGEKYLGGAETVLSALAAVCDAPLPAARILLRQFVFTQLSANGDAHAKNFSVLRGTNGEWRPSPAYDLPTSQPYGDTTNALSVGGRVTGDLGLDALIGLGMAIGLPERAARRVIADQVARVDAWLPVLDDLPFDSGVRRKLRRVVGFRRDRLAR